jgi:tetraacyldisaccharide 4'-kinase
VRSPNFWRRRGLVSDLLVPASLLYDAAARQRAARAEPVRVPVPVLCVGNIVVGGAGKTPLVLALADMLQQRGISPHIVTRGYGGDLAGPIRVDPGRHHADAVGDEALLLAEQAPTWVARDRAAGGRMAVESGAEMVLLDDGMQNHSLVKDATLLAIDGAYGFGNGRTLPAGPLREQIAPGIEKASLAVVIGEDRTGVAARLGTIPIAKARLVPTTGSASWQGRKLFAFAGIGRPEKFFETLVALGADLVGTAEFADHYRYRVRELAGLVRQAAARGAVPITTVKDWVRLPDSYKAQIEALPVRLVWNGPEDAALIDAVLDRMR